MLPIRLQTFALLTLPLLLAAAPAADTVAPGDNLVVQGVPPVPAELAESVGRYTEFRAATFASWHPTRREMLINTRFVDTPQVHLEQRRMDQGAAVRRPGR